MRNAPVRWIVILGLRFPKGEWMWRRLRVLTVFMATAVCAARSQSPLIPDKEIPLSGVEGRIDHLSADVQGQRLFVSALGNGTVEVIDLRAGRRLREIKRLEEPQGVLFDPGSHRMFVACGGDGTIRAYGGKALALLKTVTLGDDADNVRWDSQKHEVVVGYGSGGLASFTVDLKEMGSLELPAHPESFQIEQNGNHLYVNLPDSHSIAVIDRNRDAVVDVWRPSAAANFPMALDEDDHRLFVGFRSPARLLVLNTADGTTVAQMQTVGDTDDLFYDSENQRVYVIGGEGFISVYQQRDADHYDRIDGVSTTPGARTGLFVPALHRLYIAAPQRGEEDARILVFRTQ